MNRIVGIGEYIISDNEEDILKTFALATCIALTVYSPLKKVLGMVHIALPSSNINPDNTLLRPGYFADTAIPLLINKICLDYDCCKYELIVNIYGGAQSICKTDVFNIGKRNIDAVKEILSHNSIPFNAEETGGTNSRTVEMDVATGTVKIYLQPIQI